MHINMYIRMYVLVCNALAVVYVSSLMYTHGYSHIHVRTFADMQKCTHICMNSDDVESILPKQVCYPHTHTYSEFSFICHCFIRQAF